MSDERRCTIHHEKGCSTCFVKDTAYNAPQPSNEIEGKVTMEEVIKFTLERFSNFNKDNWGAAVENVKMNMMAWKKMRSEGKWPNPPDTPEPCECGHSLDDHDKDNPLQETNRYCKRKTCSCQNHTPAPKG